MLCNNIHAQKNIYIKYYVHRKTSLGHIFFRKHLHFLFILDFSQMF